MSATPLALPLEVIERILRFALVVPTSSTFTPALSPPKAVMAVSHLLLVSHGIRELCLPYFWKTVTIAKSEDWHALFGLGVGLFVVGEEGRRRWSCVEELNILDRVDIPLRTEPIKVGGPQRAQDWLKDLDFPSWRRLPRLMIHSPSAADASNRKRWEAQKDEREEAFRRLLLSYQTPKDIERLYDIPSRHIHLLRRRHPPKQETAEEQALRVETYFMHKFDDDLHTARSNRVQQVCRNLQPIHICAPIFHFFDGHDGLDDHTVGDSAARRPDLIEVRGTGEKDEVSIDDVTDLIYSVESSWSKARCRLVGYSEQTLEWTEDELVHGPWDAESGWNSIWSWTRPDGSEFRHDFGAQNTS